MKQAFCIFTISCLLVGCISINEEAVSKIPITITSEPEGAEIWSVPEAENRDNYFVYQKESGSYSSSDTEGSDIFFLYKKKHINIGKYTPPIKVGTTPFHGEIYLVGDNFNAFRIDDSDGCITLMHVRASVLNIPPFQKHNIELSIEYELRYDDKSEEIRDVVSKESKSIVSMEPVDKHIYQSWRALSPKGIKIHTIIEALKKNNGDVDISDKLSEFNGVKSSA